MRVYNCSKCLGIEMVSDDVEHMHHFHNGITYLLQESPVGGPNMLLPEHLIPIIRAFSTDPMLTIEQSIRLIKNKTQAYKIQDALMKVFEELDK